MTTRSTFEHDLPAILEDLYLGPTPDYRDAVLAAATRTRQRPSWTFAGRWIPMADIATRPARVPRISWRAVGLVLLIIALLLVTALAVGSRQPRVPPPFGPAGNGLIVYPRAGDIFAFDPATNASTALITGRTNDLDALFSPDGARVAFSRLSDNPRSFTLKILAAKADGSDPTTITTTPLKADGLRFQWAPDSRSLYIQTGLFETGPLRILQLDTTTVGEPRLLATGAELLPNAARPPDGQELLIRRAQGQGQQLIVLNPVTMEERMIAEGGLESIRSAGWSTNGRQVAYSTTDLDDPASMRLWIVNADGANPHQVTRGSGTWVNDHPAWSPDDGRIAFTQYERTSVVDSVDWDIRPIGILDIATGKISSIGPIARDVRKAHPTDHDASAGALERLAFDWSPDGTTILAIPTEASGHPVVINPESGAWTALETIVDEQGAAAQTWQRTAP